MSYNNTYTKGVWLSLCDQCGRKVKSSSLRLRWDGLMVDNRCWEPRQPQDFVRASVDVQTVPWSRLESSDVFTTLCDSQSSLAGYAVAGCSVAGILTVPGGGPVPSSSFTQG